jgi:hypothetical protein
MVGHLEGRDLARSFGAPFIECSAAEGVNVDVAFRQLVKLVRKEERVSQPRSACPGVESPVGSGVSTEEEHDTELHSAIRSSTVPES